MEPSWFKVFGIAETPHLLLPKYKLGVQKHAQIQRGAGGPDRLKITKI